MISDSKLNVAAGETVEVAKEGRHVFLKTCLSDDGSQGEVIVRAGNKTVTMRQGDSFETDQPFEFVEVKNDDDIGVMVILTIGYGSYARSEVSGSVKLISPVVVSQASEIIQLPAVGNGGANTLPLRAAQSNPARRSLRLYYNDSYSTGRRLLVHSTDLGGGLAHKWFNGTPQSTYESAYFIEPNDHIDLELTGEVWVNNAVIDDGDNSNNQNGQYFVTVSELVGPLPVNFS